MLPTETRGQLIFRQCADQVTIGVGILEVPGTLRATETSDIRVEFIAQGWKTARQLYQLYPAPHKLPNQYAEYELSGILTDLDYYRASNEGLIPEHGGAMLIRATRLPAKTGHSTYLIALAMESAGIPADHRTVHNITEIGGMLAIQPGRVISEETNGMSIAQVHKLPVWGWNDEPWGPISTLRIDFIDTCQKLDDMCNNPDQDPAEYQRELEKTEARWLFSRKDPQFENFRIEMHRSMPIQWDGYLTASQSARRAEKADEIIRKIMA